jgi:hypothetical protein
MSSYNHKSFETGNITSGLTKDQLLEMARVGSIKREDYIRKDGHKTWHRADTVKGIEEILDSHGSETGGNTSAPSDGDGSGGGGNVQSDPTAGFVGDSNPDDVPIETGEYSLKEITGIDASGMREEIFVVESNISCLKSSWKGWTVWPILSVPGFIWALWMVPIAVMTFMFEGELDYLVLLQFLVVSIMVLAPSLITTSLFIGWLRNGASIRRLEKDLSKKIDDRESKINLQAPYLKEVFKGWCTPDSISTVEIAAVESWNFVEGCLLYNEGGAAVYNPEEDRLSLLKKNDISSVKYEFDRKHLGSSSRTESDAAAGATGAILGAVVGGLIFDADIGYGDVATAGVVGSIIGGSKKRQSVVNEYEEHTVVDIYSKNNALPHLAVDFISNKNSAKKFFAYIQNCIPGGSTE